MTAPRENVALKKIPMRSTAGMLRHNNSNDQWGNMPESPHVAGSLAVSSWQAPLSPCWQEESTMTAYSDDNKWDVMSETLHVGTPPLQQERATTCSDDDQWWRTKTRDDGQSWRTKTRSDSRWQGRNKTARGDRKTLTPEETRANENRTWRDSATPCVAAKSLRQERIKTVRFEDERGNNTPDTTPHVHENRAWRDARSQSDLPFARTAHVRASSHATLTPRRVNESADPVTTIARSQSDLPFAGTAHASSHATSPPRRVNESADPVTTIARSQSDLPFARTAHASSHATSPPRCWQDRRESRTDEDTSLRRSVCTEPAAPGPTRFIQFRHQSKVLTGDVHNHALFLRQFLIDIFGDKVSEQKMGIYVELASKLPCDPTIIDRKKQVEQEKIMIDMSEIVVHNCAFVIKIRQLTSLAIMHRWNNIPQQFYLCLASIGNRMRALTVNQKNIILLPLKSMAVSGLLPTRPYSTLVEVILGALKTTDLTGEDWTRIKARVKSLTKDELMP